MAASTSSAAVAPPTKSSATQAPRGQATYSINRDALGFDFNKLVLYLYETVPQFIAPLRIEKFALGQSNPTFFLVDGREQKYVLRKKPAGTLLSPTAHAVEREYQVLHGLGTCGHVPVPRVYTLCTDASVIGTPFYVMEFVKGRIFPSPALPEIPAKDRRAYWEAAIRTLARLHSTDLRKANLTSYGPSGGFYQRQLKTLIKVSDAQAEVKDAKRNAVGAMPERELLKQWFEANMPADEATIIHGDFKFDNLIFHPTRSEVIGILDWELSTLGHPLSDLANFLMSHYAPSQMTHSSIVGIQGRSAELGIPSLSECLDLYCQAAGRPRITSFDFYAAFVFFKFAVITQGVRARMYRGQASSREADSASRLFEPCAEIAGRIIREAGAKGKSKL